MHLPIVCASRLAALVLCCVAISAAVIGAVKASRADDPDLELAHEVGDDPFTIGVTTPAPIEFTTLRDISSPGGVDVEAATSARALVRHRRRRLDAVIATARRHGVDVEAPASPAGAPLYGGSGRNACDKAQLIRFLRTHEREAAAWARVHRIEPSEIPDYVDGLTGGWLLADTEVVNHGFDDGEATPRRSTLEAGTAVLVDADSVPRVRCICGNPLRETLVDLNGTLVDGQAFADAVGDFALERGAGRRAGDPGKAVGPPDCADPSCGDDTYVSLGMARRRCEYFLTLRFVDNVLISGAGDDLRVVEVPTTEPTDLYVIVSGEPSRVGRVEGGDTSVDITPAVPLGAEIREIRLCDTPDTVDTYPPGADIDAVAALNWEPR
jgi:hypothetical protein